MDKQLIKALIIFAILFIVLALTSLDANAACKQIDIDILQAKSPNENIIVVYVEEQRYAAKVIEGDLANKDVYKKIERWFDGIIKEVCK